MLSFQHVMEQRKHTRFDTNWPAWLVIDGGVESCRVVDISLGGAKIRRTSQRFVPLRVKLVVQEPRFTAICEPCHSAGGYLGVRFIGAENVPYSNAA